MDSIMCIQLWTTELYNYSVGHFKPFTIYALCLYLLFSCTSASELSPMQQVTSTVLGLSVTLVTVVIVLVTVIVVTVILIAYIIHLKKKQGMQNPPLYSYSYSSTTFGIHDASV